MRAFCLAFVERNSFVFVSEAFISSVSLIPICTDFPRIRLDFTSHICIYTLRKKKAPARDPRVSRTPQMGLSKNLDARASQNQRGVSIGDTLDIPRCANISKPETPSSLIQRHFSISSRDTLAPHLEPLTRLIRALYDT